MDKTTTKNNWINYTTNKNIPQKITKEKNPLLNRDMDADYLKSSNFEILRKNVNPKPTNINNKSEQTASSPFEKSDDYKKTDKAGRDFEKIFQQFFTALNFGNLNLINIPIIMKDEVLNDIYYFGCFPDNLFCIKDGIVSYGETNAYLGKLVYVSNDKITEIKGGTVFEFKRNLGTSRKQKGKLIEFISKLKDTQNLKFVLKSFLEDNYCPKNSGKLKNYSIKDQMMSQINFSNLTIKKLKALVSEHNEEELRLIFNKFFIYTNVFSMIKKSASTYHLTTKHAIINSQPINNFVLLFNGINPDTIRDAIVCFADFFKAVMPINILAIYCREDELQRMNISIVEVLMMKDRKTQDQVKSLVEENEKMKSLLEENEKKMNSLREEYEKKMNSLREENEKKMNSLKEENELRLQSIIHENTEMKLTMKLIMSELAILKNTK